MSNPPVQGANPDCPVCHGAGFVYPDRGNGFPDYGRTIRCKAEGCYDENWQKKRMSPESMAARGVTMRGLTFESYLKVWGAIEAYEAFYSLAHRRSEKPFLLVYGEKGNGKTHLMEATATELVKRGIDARLFPVVELCSLLHAAIGDHSLEQVTERLQKVEALLLDDFGTELGSALEMERLYQIIDYRYRQESITVLTSNRDLTELEEDPWGARIMSRMRDSKISTVVLNKAPDYRRR